MKKIIAVTGSKGSGKDTAYHAVSELVPVRKASFAQPLKEEVAMALCTFNGTKYGLKNWLLGNNDYNLRTFLKSCGVPKKVLDTIPFARIFSDKDFYPDYETAMQNVLNEQFKNENLRELLQVWGTEYRRDITDSDYWTKKLVEGIYFSDFTEQVIMCTDPRFPNEIDALVTLKNKGYDLEFWHVLRDTKKDKSSQHSSETSLDNYNWDGLKRTVIDNNGTLGVFYDKVQELYNTTQQGTK